MAWKVFIESPEVRHVIPLDDAGSHLEVSRDKELPFGTEPVCDCSCAPRWEDKDGVRIFIHNSFDGREGLEWAMDLLK